VRPRQADTVLYLYGITKSPASKPPQVRGVDDVARIEAITCNSLVCWVSRVPASEFAENLAKNAENLDWLSAISVRHQRAVAAISEKVEILPARLGTVFLNETSLVNDIQSRRAALQSDLKRIEGAEEWGIRVFRAAATAPIATAPRSGKEYLKAKSAHFRARSPQGPDEEVQRLAGELAQFGPTAAGGKISGGRRDLQYHVTLLLRRKDRAKFQATLRRFSREWKGTRSLECTGPWPPYSFVSVAESEPRRGARKSVSS